MNRTASLPFHLVAAETPAQGYTWGDFITTRPCNCDGDSATGATLYFANMTMTRMICDHCEGVTGPTDCDVYAPDSYWDSKKVLDHQAAMRAARLTGQAAL